MLSLSKKENSLQKIVDANGWARKRVIWETIEATSLVDFPRLTINDLRRITIGVYQLKQAASYTREHIDDDGNYMLQVHKEREDIVIILMQSRHTTSKQYHLWIQYESDSFDPIRGWYCLCKNGARVVGCCAHIASVLWCLGYYRHYDRIPQYHSDHYPEFLLDAADFQVSDEETEEE